MICSWESRFSFIATVILLLDLFSQRNCEIFSSVAQIENFVDLSHEIQDKLKEYIANVEWEMAGMRKSLGERADQEWLLYQGNRSRENENLVAVLSTFARIRRKLRTNLASVLGIKSEHKKFISYLEEIKRLLPSQDDVDGSTDAIIRLQGAYQLDARSLIALCSDAAPERVPLGLEEAYQLGRAAFVKNKMKITRGWMMLALEKLANDTGGGHSLFNNSNVNFNVDIRDHLAYVNFKLGEYGKALVFTKEILKFDSSNSKALNNIKLLDKTIKRKGCTERKRDDNEDYYLHRRYESLCRGEIPLRKRRERRRGRGYVCGYIDGDPILVIKPMKYEIVSTKPEIRLIYEMASNYETKVLQRLAFPQLERASVSDLATNSLMKVSYRTSQSGWLHDHMHEVVRKINRRMEAVTGLSAKTAEDLQVANYGIGGHYEPHYDWSRNYEFSEMKKRGDGNRIATALLYLNDVPRGGATVFTDAEVALWPKQGSMAFWYNLHRNGTGKVDTIHAACPVLIGNKWVANKWFHERGQEFHRRCSLERLQ